MTACLHSVTPSRQPNAWETEGRPDLAGGPAAATGLAVPSSGVPRSPDHCLAGERGSGTGGSVPSRYLGSAGDHAVVCDAHSVSRDAGRNRAARAPGIYLVHCCSDQVPPSGQRCPCESSTTENTSGKNRLSAACPAQGPMQSAQQGPGSGSAAWVTWSRSIRRERSPMVDDGRACEVVATHPHRRAGQFHSGSPLAA